MSFMGYQTIVITIANVVSVLHDFENIHSRTSGARKGELSKLVMLRFSEM